MTAFRKAKRSCKFRVGQRVRWISQPGDNPDCDTGFVTAILLLFAGTDLEEYRIQIKLDKPMFDGSMWQRFGGGKTYEITTAEANVEVIEE